jgi:hypothetical protein
MGQGTTPPPNLPVLGLSGPPALAQVSYTPVGQLAIELVSIDPTVSLSRNAAGKLTVSSTGPVIVSPANVVTLTLAKNVALSTSSEVWCPAVTTKVTAAAVLETRVYTNPANNANTYSYSVIGIPQVTAQPGFTTTVAPTWTPDICSSNTAAGLVFPTNSLGTGETRTAVTIVAVTQ